MKKLLVTALLATALSTPFALAHEGKRAPDFDRLAERLEVDASQLEAFKAVMQEQHEKRVAQRQEMMKTMKANKEALDQETRDKLANVLNQEQLSELQEIQEKPRHRGHGKHHFKGGEDAGGKVGEQG